MPPGWFALPSVEFAAAQRAGGRMTYLEDGRSSGIPCEGGERLLRKFGAANPSGFAKDFGSGDGAFLARPRPNRLPPHDERGRIVGFPPHCAPKRLCRDEPVRGR